MWHELSNVSKSIAIMDGNVIAFVIPLLEHLGLVTYDKNDDNSGRNMLLIFPICA